MDLNLLLALHALIETGSVSESARRLHVGQPAASHMLKRLREVLGDPLLRRKGQGMEPTPFATGLKPRIEAWLEQASQLMRTASPFDPAQATGTLRLAMPDLLEATLLPGVLGEIQRSAPNIHVVVEAMSTEAVEVALIEGRIDAALGYFPSPQAPLQRELLFKAFARGFYSIRQLRRPSMDTPKKLAQPPHIFTSYMGESQGVIDRKLHREGLSRRIIASTASLLAIAHILDRVPAVAILPDFAASSLGKDSSIRSVPVLRNSVAIPVEVVWSPKARQEELLAFFRSILSQQVCSRKR